MLANEILDGISLVIHREYPGAQIWLRSVDQGLKEGDFILSYLISGKERLPGNRFRETHSYQIIYFPHSTENAMEVGGSLCELLEVIEVEGGALRGSGLGYEMVDEALQMTLRYACMCRKEISEEKMEVIDYAAGV